MLAKFIRRGFSLLNTASTQVDTIEIDCIYRSASEGAVLYDAYQANP